MAIVMRPDRGKVQYLARVCCACCDKEHEVLLYITEPCEKESAMRLNGAGWNDMKGIGWVCRDCLEAVTAGLRNKLERSP